MRVKADGLWQEDKQIPYGKKNQNKESGYKEKDVEAA